MLYKKKLIFSFFDIKVKKIIFSFFDIKVKKIIFSFIIYENKDTKSSK
jgi:hypothetical protein